MIIPEAIQLRYLPLTFRLGICALVVTLLGGYIVSGIHLRWHYENRDESPGLTMNDIIGAYHGVNTPSPLVLALESGHPETLDTTQRSALLDWLDSDRVSEDYDNFDLGDDAPSEIIAMSCLECHSRSSTGSNSMGDAPLEYWDDIRTLAFSKDIQPAGTNIVATSQHVHAPMMALVMIVLAFLGVLTRFSDRVVGWLVCVAGIGLLADMAGWWITRDLATFAYAIVIGGGLYALATVLVGCLVIVDCLLPVGKRESV
jgi:hypothetical protein